jgi:CHAT domain-containing protein
MNPTTFPDVHAPYVQELVAAGDWAGLARYWLAHRHEAALDAAIELVSERAGRQGGLWSALGAAIGLVSRRTGGGRGQWPALGAFLVAVRENPLDLKRQASAEMVRACTPGDQATLSLLLLDPRAALCEMAMQFPAQHQDRLLEVGIQAAEQACQVAGMLEDGAAEAFFRVMLARGLQEARRLEAARDSYQEALTIRRELARQRPDVYRPDVAMTLNNLGLVQRALNDLEAARDSYQEALTIRRELARQRPDVYRPDVATTLGNLGNVQADLNDLEAARDSFQEAATLYTQDAISRPTARLAARQGTWHNLGTLYLRDHSPLGWPDRHRARAAFRKARDCAETFRLRFTDTRQRQRVQGEALHVYERLVQTCAEIGALEADAESLKEGVEVAESSRARNLMEMLADEALQPATAPADRVEEFRALRRRLRQFQRLVQDADSSPAPLDESITVPGTRQRGPGGVGVPELPCPSEPSRPAARLEELNRALDRVQTEYTTALRRLQADCDPEFDPDRPVRPISFAEVQTLLPADVPTAIVQYSLTRERGLALLVTHEHVEAVMLPDLNDRQAWELAEAWYDAYYGHRDTRDDALPGLLEPVAERAVRPVWQALAARGLRRLVLSPNRALHLFPLHACRLADGRYLADACEVVYTPSLSILHRCVHTQRPQPRRLVLAENPTGDLPFTVVEAAALRRLYSDHLSLARPEITKERLLQDAAGSHVLHYSGHAGFDLADPLRSALVLEGKDDTQRDRWLSLRDVFTRLHLQQNVLTVLNGCESGMVVPDRVDEYVGLPSGFLYAGATCVLSTLWAVYDLSSALLSVRFHQEWLGGKSIAAALHAAQRWLRDDVRDGRYLQQVVLPEVLKLVDDPATRQRCEEAAAKLAVKYPDRPPFASPVHWAPFIATGLAYPLSGRA